MCGPFNATTSAIRRCWACNWSYSAALVEFLLSDDPESMPLPFEPMWAVSVPALRSCFYEAGFSLYNAGQCLSVVL
jgi:hypothetical protein